MQILMLEQKPMGLSCLSATGTGLVHSLDRGNIAMLVAASIILQADVITLGIHEARLPIARVVFGIMQKYKGTTTSLQFI